MELLIQLVAGILGGNAAGAALKNKSLGPVGNSIAGLLGGGIGGQILQALGFAADSGGAGALDAGAVLSALASGGVGGGALMTLIGLIKPMLARK